MNNIDKIRTDIKMEFKENIFQKIDFETFVSPNGHFRLEATNFCIKEQNRYLTKVEIFNQKLNEKIFDFFVNDSSFFYGWVSAKEVEYLICAEDIFGGQTVVDLTNRKMAGYSPNEDGFIWTDFYLSPDGRTLATKGCYWACPYVIKLFDFSEPLNLPLNKIREIELLNDDEIILGWADNVTLQMKGVQRELEPEYFEDGGFRMKTISETNIERRIKINGK